MARLAPLFSGSTGNSYYIGSRSAGLLIDCGRSARQMDAMLRRCGVDPLAIQGILVTHEHSDHITGLRVFAKKYRLPVYASAGTCAAIAQQMESELRVIGEGEEIAGMVVKPFHTSHDCAEGMGFRVYTGDDRVFALATDTGWLTPEVREHLLGADLTVIESNHDVRMLREGRYPYPLQRRILSDRGHLSNDACAAFLPQLAESGCRRFVLAHLSRENNTPQLALGAAAFALEQAGLVRDVDFSLEAAAPENTAGGVILF